jgi:bifunctional DNA-binding transcriptional regulator/antitoxin component of YhaV-PrlF toxin-antitoxin module
MKSGHNVRVSIPRDVQRHLGIRVGDHLVIGLQEGGLAIVHRLDPEQLRRGIIQKLTPRSD